MQQAAGAEQRLHAPHTLPPRGEGGCAGMVWQLLRSTRKTRTSLGGRKNATTTATKRRRRRGRKKEFVFVGDEQRWQQRRKSATKTATPEKSPTTATTRRRRSRAGGVGAGKERGRRCRRCGIACCSLARRFRHFPFGCRCLFGLLWPSNGAWAAGQQGRGGGGRG